MIVEDDPVISFAIRETLISSGYTVCGIETSGEAAVINAGKNEPDLIFMDIRLDGEMTGIDAAAEIRSSRDIPVVYLTAFSNEELFDRSMYTEPFGYLVKPANPRDIMIAADMAIYKHGIEKALKDAGNVEC